MTEQAFFEIDETNHVVLEWVFCEPFVSFSCRMILLLLALRTTAWWRTNHQTRACLSPYSRGVLGGNICMYRMDCPSFRNYDDMHVFGWE